jgi:hypothetical protein
MRFNNFISLFNFLIYYIFLLKIEEIICKNIDDKNKSIMKLYFSKKKEEEGKSKTKIRIKLSFIFNIIITYL